MKILVTGGAGYIGSFIVKALKEKKYEVVVIDNLSAGHKDAIKDVKLINLDLSKEKGKLIDIFKIEKFDGVIHMASFIQMGESYKNPGKYFDNNLLSAINILEAMMETNTKNIVFSSSAGVYGTPKTIPIKEDDPKSPENPYGETKLMIEKILYWYHKAFGIKSISIRYFNAAGGALDGTIGEDHPGESHLIPLIIKSMKEDKEFKIFGNDYKTIDGTCVRDYIHVIDLANAHIKALEMLSKDKILFDAFNAGMAKGYSNLQIVKLIEKFLNKKLNYSFAEKRPGDTAILVASTEKIKKFLNWTPKLDINDIIKSACLWHSKNPKGYQ